MIELSVHKKLKSPSGDMLLQVEAKIGEGSLVALYGRSGAGKTSLLKILAGLLSPDSGRIVVNGTPWTDTRQRIDLRPRRRRVGFVFQDYALFPNMTVRENLRFALEKGQDKTIVRELIELTELGELQHRKPAMLSGGQQQRVALARALVQRPQLLLLDEPLSALDHDMRTRLQEYILQVHREYRLNTILVSHEPSEILKMADRLWVLEQGKVEQQGRPAELFTHKKVSGKFQFTGEVVAIEKQDVVFIVSILIGKDLVKVVADDHEAATLRPGDRVLVASKAFNPIIRKIG